MSAVTNIIRSLMNIFRSRTRSVLTMAGIAVGVFSVVLISVVGTVGTAQVSKTLVTMGVDTLLVQAAAQIGHAFQVGADNSRYRTAQIGDDGRIQVFCSF